MRDGIKKGGGAGMGLLYSRAISLSMSFSAVIAFSINFT